MQQPLLLKKITTAPLPTTTTNSNIITTTPSNSNTITTTTNSNTITITSTNSNNNYYHTLPSSSSFSFFLIIIHYLLSRWHFEKWIVVDERARSIFFKIYILSSPPQKSSKFVYSSITQHYTISLTFTFILLIRGPDEGKKNFNFMSLIIYITIRKIIYFISFINNQNNPYIHVHLKLTIIKILHKYIKRTWCITRTYRFKSIYIYIYNLRTYSIINSYKLH